MAERSELPVAHCTERDPLNGSRTAANGAEHVTTREHQFHRAFRDLSGHRRKHFMRPRPAFAAESATREMRHDPHLLGREAKRTCHAAAYVENALSRLIQCESIAFPRRRRVMDLHRIVILERRRVRLTHADGGAGKPMFDVPAFRNTLAAERPNGFRWILRCGRHVEYGRRRRVADTNQRQRCHGMLERVRDHDADRLSVVVHEIVLQERRNPHGRASAALASSTCSASIRLA